MIIKFNISDKFFEKQNFEYSLNMIPDLIKLNKSFDFNLSPLILIKLSIFLSCIFVGKNFLLIFFLISLVDQLKYKFAL